MLYIGNPTTNAGEKTQSKSQGLHANVTHHTLSDCQHDSDDSDYDDIVHEKLTAKPAPLAYASGQPHESKSIAPDKCNLAPLL